MQVEKGAISAPSKIDSAYLLQEQYEPRVLEYNPAEPFVAASLAKLWIAAATFHLTEQQVLDLRAPLQITLEQLQKGVYGTGSRRWRIQTKLSTLAGRSLVTPKPLDFLLHRMVANSDNLANLIVADHVGRERLQQVVDSWDMFHTTIFNPRFNQPNMTAAEDITLFLRNLQKGVLISPSHAQRLRSWMAHKPFASAENLPAHLWSFTGRITEDGKSYFHRAGFVEVLGRNYVFAVLTQGPEFRRRGISYEQERKMTDLMELVTEYAV